jgi:hypothetical protein
MDWLEALLGLWEMYHNNPIFWIILVPFMLWWLNFFRKQLIDIGIKKLIPKVLYYTEKKLLSRQKETQPSVTPSPRSGYVFKLWQEILIIPLMMSPFIFLIAFSTTIPLFSLRWWSVVFWTTVVIIAMGTPIYIMVIFQWVRIKSTINKAVRRMNQLSSGDKETGKDYLGDFIVLADDFRMGLDPRLISVLRPQKVDSQIYLNELTDLGLIKPDRKVKRGTLAHRYYLTRSGATLVEKVKGKEKQCRS